MLLEPPTHTENAPAPALDQPGIPDALAGLAARSRQDPAARRELADALLVRRWSPDMVAATVDMGLEAVRALSRIRRPGTAAAHVAAALVPNPRTAA